MAENVKKKVPPLDHVAYSKCVRVEILTKKKKVLQICKLNGNEKEREGAGGGG